MKAQIPSVTKNSSIVIPVGRIWPIGPRGCAYWAYAGTPGIGWPA